MIFSFSGLSPLSTMLIIEGATPLFLAHSFWPPARFTAERSKRITSFWSRARMSVFFRTAPARRARKDRTPRHVKPQWRHSPRVGGVRSATISHPILNFDLRHPADGGVAHFQVRIFIGPKMMTKELYLESIRRKLTSNASWRRGVAASYPDDGRNVRAAETLGRLAKADSREIRAETWAAISKHLDTRTLREAISKAAADVAFRRHPANLDDFLQIVIEKLAAPTRH
jgi:hypothetical protein